MAEEFTLFVQHLGVIIGHSWKYNYWSFMEIQLNHCFTQNFTCQKCYKLLNSIIMTGSRDED